MGAQKLSRPQVVKQLWIYIKAQGLQDPNNGKEILLDDNMKALFGGDKINMFTMNKSLGQYVLILSLPVMSTNCHRRRHLLKE